MNNANAIRVTAATASVVAATAVAFGSLTAFFPTETLGAETRTADFEATFKSASKPREVLGQWAQASYTANNSSSSANSPYSTTVQGTKSQGHACAHGGSGVKCGDDSTRSGSSVSIPAQSQLDWTPDPSWRLAAFYFTLDAGATTKVACRPDGSVEAFEPTWGIKYGNGSYYRNRGMQELRWNDNKTIDSGEQFRRLSNGQTFTFVQKSSNSADTYGEISITPKWGTNQQTREAWSELTINVVPFYQPTRSQTGGPWTYTLRSRCGLNMNDGTGSTGPSANTTVYANGAGIPDVSAGAELPWVEEGTELPEINAAAKPSADTTTELENVTGLTRRDDLVHGAGEFEVEATRELLPADIQHIQAVMDRASFATDDAGEVDGHGWIRRQANALPVVTLALPGGGYARVTPRITSSEAQVDPAADDLGNPAEGLNSLNEAIITEEAAG